MNLDIPDWQGIYDEFVKVIYKVVLGELPVQGAGHEPRMVKKDQHVGVAKIAEVYGCGRTEQIGTDQKGGRFALAREVPDFLFVKNVARVLTDTRPRNRRCAVAAGKWLITSRADRRSTE